MTAVSAQAGSHRADQVFVACDIVGRTERSETSPFIGLLLELSTEAHVVPSSTKYFPEMPDQVGRLRMYTADMYAAHLLGLSESLDSDIHAVNVVIQLLTFEEDLYPKRLRITGVEDSTFSTEEALSVVEVENNAEGVEEAMPVLGDQSVDTGDIDFTVLLSCHDEKPTCSSEKPIASARPRKKAKQTGSNQVDDSDVLEFQDDMQSPPPEGSLLDDPSLVAFMELSDIVNLRQAVNVCKDADKSSDVACWRARADTAGTSFSDSGSESDADVVATDDAPEEGAAAARSSSSSSSTTPSVPQATAGVKCARPDDDNLTDVFEFSVV